MIVSGSLLLIGTVTGGIFARERLRKIKVNRVNRNRDTTADMKTLSCQKVEPPPLLDNVKIIKTMPVHLVYALGAFGVAVTSKFFYPPLTLFALPPLIYATIPVLKASLANLNHRKKWGVAILDLTGIVIPLCMGYTLLAAFTTALVLSSHWLLRLTEDRSNRRLVNIYSDLPDNVCVEKKIRGEFVQIAIPLAEVKVGEVVVVAAGEVIPVDGIVSEGVARLDERSLTGESQLVEKQPGDQVHASTLLVQGRLYVRVEQAGNNCLAAQITDLLNNTTDWRDEVRSRGQRAVEKGSIPTLGLAGISLLFLGPAAAVSMSFAGFGYSMRYAAPVAVLQFLEKSSRQGILVKDGRALEVLSQIDTVIFDKTGTLTEDSLEVVNIDTLDGFDENRLLSLAASAEQHQHHPIALAILEFVHKCKLHLFKTEDVSIDIGKGLQAVVDGINVVIGSERLATEITSEQPEALAKLQHASTERGNSLIYIILDNQIAGTVELAAKIRPEASEVISFLHQRNLNTYIISGDHEAPTRELAKQLNIPNYLARILPQEKSAAVKRLQEKGKKVCFIGDGINDSIALRQADVAISLSGASSIAVDSSPIVLMDASLRQLPQVFDIAYQLQRNLKVSEILSIAPGIICVGGVFLGFIGISGAFICYNLSVFSSLINALRVRQ